jgi:hypothetical protein
MVYYCDVCLYQTSRKYNLQLHVSRKNSCVPEKKNVRYKNVLPKIDVFDPNIDAEHQHLDQFDPNIDAEHQYLDQIYQNGEQRVSTMCKNSCMKCKRVFASKSGVIKHQKICKGINSLQCPTCLKIFKSAPGKCHHTKNVNCENSDKTLEKENERLRTENEFLKTNKLINITTNNINNINNTSTIKIQLNSYDKPNTEHITSKLMARLFKIHKTDPNLILNETVRRIYKNEDFPENNSIKLLNRSAYTKVYYGDKEITLPIDEVLQTILTQMSELCGDRLRDCEEEGILPGLKVGLVKDIMNTLASDDRDDRDNRLKYIPYIKSALLETL